MFPSCGSSHPRHTCPPGLGYNYKPHRDTWYSAPQCQNNWWTPIAGNSAVTGMQFHPDYWQRPAQNTSADFDAYEWNRTSRRDAAAYVKEDPRPHPRLATEIPVPRSEWSASLDRSCPSLAHSYIRPYRTRPIKARLSIDFRTVHIDDLAARIGPANVDSRVRPEPRCATTSARTPGNPCPRKSFLSMTRTVAATVFWFSIRRSLPNEFIGRSATSCARGRRRGAGARAERSGPGPHRPGDHRVPRIRQRETRRARRAAWLRGCRAR